METQNYNNHIRFYPPHHFIFYPVLTALTAFSIYKTFTVAEQLVWLFISIIFITIILLSFMLRQHYALTLQNRIVKLEFSYRYFAITGKRLEAMAKQLTDEQIFALRFAPDNELVPIVEKTLLENLSGKDIKKSIVHWKGDYQRV